MLECEGLEKEIDQLKENKLNLEKIKLDKNKELITLNYLSEKSNEDRINCEKINFNINKENNQLLENLEKLRKENKILMKELKLEEIENSSLKV